METNIFDRGKRSVTSRRRIFVRSLDNGIVSSVRVTSKRKKRKHQSFFALTSARFSSDTKRRIATSSAVASLYVYPPFLGKGILHSEITDALSARLTKPRDILIRVTIRISRTKLAKQPLSDPHNISRELAPLLVPLDHSSGSINFPRDADL